MAGPLNRHQRILAIWQDHLDTAATLPVLVDEVSRAVDMIETALRRGNRLLIAGNGGSAADAQHMAAELTGRFLRERAPLAAMALHTNSSSLTAIGNDYGFDQVFAREVTAHGRPGDVLVAISTSGNSANIVRAIEAARQIGVSVIGMTGGTGGRIQPLCDVCLCVPTRSTPRIQEMHITIAHTICELLDEGFA